MKFDRLDAMIESMPSTMPSEEVLKSVVTEVQGSLEGMTGPFADDAKSHLTHALDGGNDLLFHLICAKDSVRFVD